MKKIALLFFIFLCCLVFVWMRSSQEDLSSFSSAPVVIQEKIKKRDSPVKDLAQNENPLDNKKSTTLSLPRTLPLEEDAHPPSLEKGEYLYFEVKDGYAVAFGDVLLGEIPSNLKKGKSDKKEVVYWDSFPISYHIDPHLDEVIKKDIALAIAILEKETPLTFEKGGDHKDAIAFTVGKEDCRSFLGKQGGAQPIFLAKGCGRQQILHELLHALGFFHEHSRSDRGQYVKILWENIVRGKERDFAVVPEKYMDIVRGFAFDYQSIMLYKENYFAKAGTKTIISLLEGEQLAPAQEGLSEIDRQKIRHFYGPYIKN